MSKLNHAGKSNHSSYNNVIKLYRKLKGAYANDSSNHWESDEPMYMPCFKPVIDSLRKVMESEEK